MNIFIMTLGSRGDVQPFVALGKGLQEAGHTVTLCTASSFEDFVTEHGLNYASMTNELLELMGTDAGKDALENTTNVLQVAKTFAKLASKAGPLQHKIMDDSWQAAEAANPDLIIYHPKMYGATHFGQKLGVPVMMVATVPMYVPTTEYTALGFPKLPLGAGYNRFTFRVVLAITEMGIGRYVKAWRKKHDMPPQPKAMGVLTMADGTPAPILHCFSRHVLPRPADWPEHAIITGSWFLDDNAAWEPSAELLAFLDAGDPPVYEGFGSMSGRDPRRITKAVIDGLQQANVRGILASGWGGLSTDDLPESIFALDQAPHEWLFPRMSAVVHHGGAGTTAAGLRAGRPTIICPFFGDQPYWGKRVHELGAGSEPIPQKKLTAERLAAAIHEVQSERIRQNADALGEKIRAEDGVANAVAFIEEYMAEKRGQPTPQPV